MKKILNIALAALLCSAVIFPFTACEIDTGKTPGGNETPGGNVNPGDQEDPPQQNTDADVQITVGTLGKPDELTLMRRWINAFNSAHSEVNVTLTKQMNGMPDTTLWKSAGEMPDIVWTAGDQHSPYSGNLGYFRNLNDEAMFPGCTEFFADFYDSLIESTHYSNTDTGIWFVPRDYNRLVIYINKTAFAEAGVAIPENDWTWDDFIGICNDLMDAGAKKGVEWKKWRPVYTTMLQNFGGKYLNDDGTLAIESSATEACVDFYSKFYELRREASDPVVGLAIEGEGTSFQAYPGFIEGSVPMIVDVRPQLPGYIQAASNGGWELEARAFPNFTQAEGGVGFVGAGCSGYGITTDCKDEAKLHWAWEFLKWCMSEEGYEKVSSLGNIVPALKSLKDSGSWRDYSKYDLTVDPDAFVYSNTKDIFLNYQNSLPVTAHDDFVLRVDDFWKNVHAGKGYRASVQQLISDFDALKK